MTGIRVKLAFLPHHQEQKQRQRETKQGNVSVDERKVITHDTAGDENRVGYGRCVFDLMEAYSQLGPYEKAGTVVRLLT